jgi:membrane protein DedA with SNARE-associated domain
MQAMGWDLDRIAADLGELLGRTGSAAPLVLLLASFIEYVFPPFPGDLLVVLGAWYAVQGIVSWPVAFMDATLGAVLGALVDYAFGRWLGPRLDARASRQGKRAAERLARFEGAYRRWGPALLVVNRFLPGVRAFFFIGAGAARIPLGRVLLLGGLSAALWNALLLAAGRLLLHSLPELLELFRRYSHLAWVAMAGLTLAAVVYVVRRMARGSRGEKR